MCLIICKPKGITIPDYVITSGISQNSDGWGILYHDGVEVQAIKYLEHDIKQAERKLRSVIGRLGDTYDLYIHLRMATSGNISIENTHPFKLGNSGVWMFHNGVMNLPSVEGKSDTAVFAEMITPTLEENPKEIHSLWVDELIFQHAPFDRLLFMMPDGEVVIKGGGRWVEEAGVSLSNTYAWSPPSYIDVESIEYTLEQLMELPEEELMVLGWEDPDVLIKAILKYKENVSDGVDINDLLRRL